MSTAAALAAYVGEQTITDLVEACFNEAVVLVQTYVGSAAVPAAVMDRAIIECGQELYNRREAPNGITQFATFEGTGIRVARDPLVGVYPLVRMYLRGGFA